MQLTQDQQDALEGVRAWHESGRSNFYVAGYAGTGKTELAKIFARGKDTIYMAFTGKAASVLNARGCEPARTIHSAIYKPSGSSKKREDELREILEKEPDNFDAQIELDELMKNPGTSWRLNRESDVKNCDLVVVDECSMVSKRLGDDLTSFRTPVLWLGDPGQLPPVHGKPFVSRPPNHLLEQIHRQAAGSGIVQAATLIRKGEHLAYQPYGADFEYVYKGKFDWDVVMDADQVIVGKNATRHRMIRNIRARQGPKDWMPVVGDKMIVLKNDYELGIFNGVTCECAAVTATGEGTLEITLKYEGVEKDVEVDMRFFQETYGGQAPLVRGRDDLQHVGFGHAITGHKSQGSQWGSVVVCDDQMQMSNVEFRRRWLYTTITRAMNRCVVYA